MAELFGTTIGTSAAQVVYGMQELGFTCSMREIGSADVKQLTQPAMLFVDHRATGPESHAVVYVGVSNHKIEIWDPLLGKDFFTAQELATIWHGHAIEFSR